MKFSYDDILTLFSKHTYLCILAKLSDIFVQCIISFDKLYFGLFQLLGEEPRI